MMCVGTKKSFIHVSIPSFTCIYHHLQYLFGRYKCPFLKGSIDVLIDKHSKIEELMAKDLENWLGNLYFEVIRLPR